MRNPRIAIIDYDVGNIRSILSAIKKVGGEPILTRDRAEILGADGIILPGVGAFANAMDKLGRYGLIGVIEEFVNFKKKPALGICLGMQLLFEESEEFGLTKGLGFIQGRVVKFPIDDSLPPQKLPHIGWNELYICDTARANKSIFKGILNSGEVYFVHSFIGQPLAKDIITATARYGGREFCAALRKDNIYGCQFHPEKSGNIGLGILKNFVNIANN